MRLRHLNLADVPRAFDLSTTAGWNQTAADWQRIIQLEQRGCFGMEIDGQLAATTTLLTYGTALAWIGMVLTGRDFQRRGYARALVQAALDEALQRGVQTIKLDATEQGHPLYSSLGFIDEQPIERWQRPARPIPATCGEPKFGPIPLDLDREAFGVDRSRFLETLGSNAAVDDSAYALNRAGTRANYLGPLVARERETASRLAAAMLDDGAWFWDLLPHNAAACEIAAGLGFAPVRQLVRMRFGEPLETRDDWVFAIAGFEAG